MKATSFLRQALAMAVILVASAMNFHLSAQDNRFITNEETRNGVVVCKTIYRQDDAQLYRHLRYDYTYDEQQRITSKTALKWDGVAEEWTPYYRMVYTYGADEIVLSYTRWDEASKAYDKNKTEQVYALNDDSMPVACR